MAHFLRFAYLSPNCQTDWNKLERGIGRPSNRPSPARTQVFAALNYSLLIRVPQAEARPTLSATYY